MTRRASSLARDRRAVGALDFAIIALPLLMLVLGTIEFARLLWAREALQMAAIQGARCIGILQSSCTSGGAYNQTNARNYIIGVASSWGITLTSSDVTATANATTGACSGTASQLAEVSLSYTFNTAVPGVLAVLSGGNALTGHACFPKQS